MDAIHSIHPWWRRIILPDYMTDKDQTVFVSFSGGLTSAYMSALLKQHVKGKCIFVFENTGQEREDTLEFVQEVDQYFDLGVVWIEAIVDSRHGVGVDFKIVDFHSASRDGEPFEAVIRKYGIPNVGQMHCTSNLKVTPMHKMSIDTQGITAIGIRADEYRRVREHSDIVYPLIDPWIVDKGTVHKYWGSKCPLVYN